MVMRFTKKFFATALICMSLLATGCGEKENIGYIDTERLQDAPQIKAILDERVKKIEDASKIVEAELQQTTDQSQEAVTAAQTEFERTIEGINRAASAQIKNKIDTAIAEVAPTKNVTAVVEHLGMQKIILMGGIDLTDDVLAKLQGTGSTPSPKKDESK